MSTASGSGSRKLSRSASTIVADNAGGYHDFKIDGYSRIKSLPGGESLKSSPFTVGGHRWRIAFFPNGHDDDWEDEEEMSRLRYASLQLVLDEEATEGVLAQYEFAFMAVKRVPFFGKRIERMKPGLLGEASTFSYGVGSPVFIQKRSLEKSGAIKGDSLTVRCEIVVLSELRPEETTADAATPTAFVPPSDLHLHLGDLLQTGTGADVLFQVGGQTFPAHRWLLAARSPVFSAEFFGTMQESATTTGGVVRVEDMEEQVFEALLCFLYTDSLPEIRKEDDVAMYQHLLVAADRYSVERLKLICEEKLRKNIDVPRVATILTLAEQHHCIVLKKLCLDFLSVPANLKAVMATEGFKHLSTSCPSIKKDLDAILAS